MKGTVSESVYSNLGAGTYSGSAPTARSQWSSSSRRIDTGRNYLRDKSYLDGPVPTDGNRRIGRNISSSAVPDRQLNRRDHSLTDPAIWPSTSTPESNLKLAVED